MYTTFFGLAEAPFNLTPDPRFVYLSSRHAEALNALKYGVGERKGFILLTGEIGSGKTTICRKLVHDLREENVKTALILNPGLSELDLLKAINDEFGIASYHNSKKALLDQLNEFLLNENRTGANVVLIIDESQTLEPAALEQIRMLSNLETENEKLVQIVLIGQPELNETMALPELQQLDQRISVRYHITPLIFEETVEYIRYRLAVARAKIDIRFTDDALGLIFDFSGGVPRMINVVCDRALLGCYSQSTYAVDATIVRSAIREIGGETVRGGGVRQGDAKRANVGATVRRQAAAAGRAVAWVWSPSAIVMMVLFVFGIVAVSVAVGTAIYMASVKDRRSVLDAEQRAAQTAPMPMNPQDAVLQVLDAETSAAQQAAATSTDGKGRKPVVVASPTPTVEEYRTRLAAGPNWIYEGRDVPLVRVNNPRLTLLAAKLSMLRVWGYQVDMEALSKMPDVENRGDVVSNGIYHYVPVPGRLGTVLQYNVPLIIKLTLSEKDKASLRSEYVVILKADGSQIIVGDPLWGVSTMTKSDLDAKWAGASAMFVDSEGLGNIKRGERNERVKALQIFLRDQHGLGVDKVSGVMDVDTVEAIKKLQGFYKLPDSGNMDSLTLMIINARIMRDGPKLNNATGW